MCVVRLLGVRTSALRRLLLHLSSWGSRALRSGIFSRGGTHSVAVLGGERGCQAIGRQQTIVTHAAMVWLALLKLKSMEQNLRGILARQVQLLGDRVPVNLE